MSKVRKYDQALLKNQSYAANNARIAVSRINATLEGFRGRYLRYCTLGMSKWTATHQVEGMGNMCHSIVTAQL
jgi:hypothetical protein